MNTLANFIARALRQIEGDIGTLRKASKTVRAGRLAEVKARIYDIRSSSVTAQNLPVQYRFDGSFPRTARCGGRQRNISLASGCKPGFARFAGFAPRPGLHGLHSHYTNTETSPIIKIKQGAQTMLKSVLTMTV